MRQYGAMASKARLALTTLARQWGEAHLFKRGEKHSLLIDRTSGKPVRKLIFRGVDGVPLAPADTVVKKVKAPKETSVRLIAAIEYRLRRVTCDWPAKHLRRAMQLA